MALVSAAWELAGSRWRQESYIAILKYSWQRECEPWEKAQLVALMGKNPSLS